MTMLLRSLKVIGFFLSGGILFLPPLNYVFIASAVVALVLAIRRISRVKAALLLLACLALSALALWIGWSGKDHSDTGSVAGLTLLAITLPLLVASFYLTVTKGRQSRAEGP